MLLFSFLALSVAHNWVNSPSRSAFASSIAPALPSSTGLPHIQVIAGQPFQLEWVQGHTGYVYWMFLSAANQANLILHQPTLMDAYIAGAPVSQQSPPTGVHRQYTRSVSSSLDYVGYQNVAPVSAFYVNAFANGSNYTPRDPVFDGTFTGRSNGNNFTNCWQLTIPDSILANDRQVWYSNKTYPWLIGGAKYTIAKSSPEQPNVAQFAFPVGTPPGSYMAHYRWSGYWDVVDIEIVNGTTPVSAPYGILVPAGQQKPAQFFSVPHCEFTDPGLGDLGYTVACTQVYTNVSMCLAACARLQGLQCAGVNVVSLVNRPHVKFNHTNIPFGLTNCPRNAFPTGANATADIKICYGVAAAGLDTTDPQTYTTVDPEDPAFESTCYRKLPSVQLSVPTPPPPPPPTLWNFESYCVDCGIALRNSDPNFLPIWPMLNKSQCSNCDVRTNVVQNSTGFNSSAPLTGFTILANNTICDGINGEWSTNTTNCNSSTTVCAIQLQWPGGYNPNVDTIFLADAMILARKNPSCKQPPLLMVEPFNPSPTVNVQLAVCETARDPCCTCLGTNRKKANGWTLYQLE